MQIISIDNFNRDYQTEYVIATDIRDPDLAKKLVKGLNDVFSGESASRYYVLREDDYKPYVFNGY